MLFQHGAWGSGLGGAAPRRGRMRDREQPWCSRQMRWLLSCAWHGDDMNLDLAHRGPVCDPTYSQASSHGDLVVDRPASRDPSKHPLFLEGVRKGTSLRRVLQAGECLSRQDPRYQAISK